MERPLWVIWARQGHELRLAFYDGINRGPENFGPRPKLQIEVEPALGVDAFSAASGWTVIVVAHRRRTAMILKVRGPRS